MQYSLSNRLSSNVSGIDPDALLYIAAVETALGTPIATALPSATSNPKRIISDFIKAEKAASRWTLHKRIYLPIYANAAASAIDMVGRNVGTFTASGVTHAAGYVQGNGTSGYFDFITAQSEIGESPNATHRGFLSLIGPSSSTTVHIGAQGPTGSETYQVGSVSGTTAISQHGSISANAPLLAANQNGIFIASKTSNLAIFFRRSAAGSSVISSTSGTNINNLSARSYYAMARNSVGVASLFSSAQYGSWFCGNGLTESESIGFSANLKTLWESLTGLILP